MKPLWALRQTFQRSIPKIYFGRLKEDEALVGITTLTPQPGHVKLPPGLKEDEALVGITTRSSPQAGNCLGISLKEDEALVGITTRRASGENNKRRILV